MTIAAVRKIHLLAHRDEADDVVGFLQSAGVVEIVSASVPGPGREEGGTVAEVEELLGRLDRAKTLLRPYLPKATLLEKIYAERPVLTRREMDDIAASFDLEGLLSSCEEKALRRESLEAEVAGAEEEKKSLFPWVSLGVPTSCLSRPGSVRAVAGRLPAAQRRDVAERFGDQAFLEVVSEDTRWVYGVFFCHKDFLGPLQEGLKDAGFVEGGLPDLDSTPAERIAMLDEQCRQKASELGALRDSLAPLASFRRELLVMGDVLGSRLSRLRTEGLLGGTARTMSVEGWIARRDLPALREGLESRFGLTSMDDFPPDPREHVPVVLLNGPAVRPFGLVVDLYGLPRYGSIDPSTVMALFFALFFGLCLTDAGYGLFIAGLSGMILRSAPPGMPAGRKSFFRMFFLCGLATTVAGAAAGGWFGLQAPVRLFDPLENLMFFFLLSLSLGTLHLFAGLALRMARLIRGGDIFGAIADHGLWIVLVCAIYGLAAARSGLLPASSAKLIGAVAVAGALGIVFFQGRPGNGDPGRWVHHLPWVGATLAGAVWFAGPARPWPAAAFFLFLAAAPALTGVSVGRSLGRIGLGLYALYGITGYLSDVLSYSRLVALGLATGIIALVVNKMAVVAGEIPLVGMVVTVLVLVGGHLFNIVINLLGAFVHSCRLQYVEFFTKFYESGGKPFSPFRLETRYITISEQT